MIDFENVDCFEKMKSMENNSIDLIMTDPPYGISFKGQTSNTDWDNMTDEEYSNFLFHLFFEFERILKDDGAIVLFGSQPFITKLINSNIDNYKYSWYWVKNQGTNFFHAKHMPIRKVEEIAVFNNYLTYNAIKSKGHEPTRSAKGSSNGK